jgi:hypothetical protein
MARDVKRIVVEPMTPERRKQLRRALQRADALRAALLHERGGKPFAPSSDDVHAAREERESHYR